MVRHYQCFALTIFSLLNTVSICLIIFWLGNTSLCLFLLWKLNTYLFLKFYILFRSLIWIWIKVKWMGKIFWYTIFYYLVLTEAISLFHQQVTVMYILISSWTSFCLWCVKISCLLYVHSYMWLYIHNSLHSRKAIAIEEVLWCVSLILL